jgi:deoxyadenosine/deoxycytidine kinase
MLFGQATEFVENNESSEIDFNVLIKKRKQIKIIYIEGNIGSGKSTLVERLQNYNNDEFEFLTEPCDEWISTEINVNDNNNNKQSMLETYYKDQKHKAALFQIYALFTRLKKLIMCILKTDKKVIVYERSPLSDKNCFAKMNQNNGNIDEFDSIVYYEIFNFFNKLTNLIKPDRIIYLQLSPERCLERIIERQRGAECSITLDYLTKLHNLHEEWLCNSLNEINLGYKVEIMNAFENFKEDDNILNNFLDVLKRIAQV